MRKLVTIILCSLACIVPDVAHAKSKVLYVDSYHQGYPWSDGITQGIASVLGYGMDGSGQIIEKSNTKVQLKVHRMGTKLCLGAPVPEDATPEQIKDAQEVFKKQAALETKDLIESWQPDVVIASDDNAAQYLIAPYYKNASLPFVFCGLNWDASVYGFPCDNVTGMVEVALIPPLIKSLKEYAQGDRVGYLGGNTTTDKKEVEHIQAIFGIQLEAVLANDFAEWKKGFAEMQDRVDMLILYSTSGVKGFDFPEARQFVTSMTKIPTGCVQEEEATIALLGYSKLPTEQGQWAAETALRILDGAKPHTIPIASNKKGRISLNQVLANRLGVRFPLSMVKQAKVINQQEMLARN